MGIYKSIEKRFNWLRFVKFDKKTGFYRYSRFGQIIYIRHPRHFLNEKSNRWVCENLIYNKYMPCAGDTVIDLGAGYGEEAMFLANRVKIRKYIGVEAQPIIYECLANTFYHAGPEYIAVPYVISDQDMVKFFSQFSYASVGVVPESYIEVPTITWQEFQERYDIGDIDLFKMNIEGAEKEVLSQIDDFSKIKRFIISCHDFRAENNEGEWYRTKKFVIDTLTEQGYSIHNFKYGINWADDWVYAERN